MAPMQEKQRLVGGEKLSGLSADAHRDGGVTHRPTKKANRSSRRNDRNDAREWKKREGFRRLMVDTVLLLIIAALAVGGVWGYRALKEVYAPVWDETTVEFCIRIGGVDVASIYDEEGRSLFDQCDVWHSDHAQGELWGTVVDVDAPPEENGHTATLYLTVRSAALYRAGEGYYIGETHLLAGMKSTFRVRGIMAEGEVISLRESK